MKRVALIGTVLGLVFVAVGSAAQPSPTAAEREHIAAVKAHALLHLFNAPPGAVRVAKPSGWGGELSRSGPAPAYDVVDRFAFWRVTSSYSSVVAFVRAHPPAGLHHWEGSQTSPGQSPVYAEDSYSRRGMRFLNVAVVQLPGRVAIRVDAKVVWFLPRSPTEKIPSSIREIDITTSDGRTGRQGAIGPQGPAGGNVPIASQKVVDPAFVAKIVRWFDALPVAPSVTLLCGASSSAAVKFVFRSADGTRVASASVPQARRASVCSEIGFAIHGKLQTPLVDRPYGGSFLQRVEKLLSASRR